MCVRERDRDRWGERGREGGERWLVRSGEAGCLFLFHCFFVGFFFLITKFSSPSRSLIITFWLRCIPTPQLPPQRVITSQWKQKIKLLKRKLILCLRNKGTKGISVCLKQTIGSVASVNYPSAVVCFDLTRIGASGVGNRE